jgi:hypothetical protein
MRWRKPRKGQSFRVAAWTVGPDPVNPPQGPFPGRLPSGSRCGSFAKRLEGGGPAATSGRGAGTVPGEVSNPMRASGPPAANRQRCGNGLVSGSKALKPTPPGGFRRRSCRGETASSRDAVERCVIETGIAFGCPRGTWRQVLRANGKKATGRREASRLRAREKLWRGRTP